MEETSNTEKEEEFNSTYLTNKNIRVEISRYLRRFDLLSRKREEKIALL